MIQNIVIEKINHISLPAAINKDVAKDLETAATAWIELPVQIHVFDFRMVGKVHSSIYAPMAKFKKDLEKQNKGKVISINLRPDVLRQVQSDGMTAAIGYVKQLANIEKAKNKDSAGEMRTWMIKYLIDAARDAMNTMFSVTVAADDKYSENHSDFGADRFFKVAAISAQSPLMKARLRLYFEKPCLEGLAKVISNNETADDELVSSTASELLNLIYGAAKSKLNNDRGYDFSPAIPVVIPVAQALTERKAQPAQLSLIPFVTPLGSYYLEVELYAS